MPLTITWSTSRQGQAIDVVIVKAIYACMPRIHECDRVMSESSRSRSAGFAFCDFRFRMSAFECNQQR